MTVGVRQTNFAAKVSVRSITMSTELAFKEERVLLKNDRLVRNAVKQRIKHDQIEGGIAVSIPNKPKM